MILDRNQLSSSFWYSVPYFDDADELEDTLNKYFHYLCPQDQKILKERLPIDETRITTYKKMEEIFDVSTTRVRALFMRAIRRLYCFKAHQPLLKKKQEECPNFKNDFLKITEDLNTQTDQLIVLCNETKNKIKENIKNICAILEINN